MSLVKSIEKENLRIARENMGLDTEAVSKRISKSKKITDIVGSFESGEVLPSWSQVSQLGKIYGVSPILFFQKGGISRNKQIPDYRVGASAEGNLGVNKLINLVISRQRWLEVRLKADGVKENRLQGVGQNIQTPRELARLIRERLGVDLEIIKKMAGNGAREKALRYLINRAEEKGIFVGKTVSYHKIEPEDLRGLFISNKYCPYIVINRRDALAAQIFSLIHELAHLFRKEDSLSNSIDFRSIGNPGSSEEVFCNRVAAEFLLPEEELAENFYSESDIEQLSITYKVSSLAVFYRLKELRKLNMDSVDILERKLLQESKQALELKLLEDKKKPSGGNYVNAMKDSNGGLLNRYVLRLYSDNDIGHVEARNILRVSPEMA